MITCTQPAGTVASGEDCDDTDGDISPDAREDFTDGLDNDCDGSPEFTGPVEVTADDTLVEYQVETTTLTKLRMLGVDGTSGGVIRVHVDVAQPTVLVLADYDGSDWEITEEIEGSVQGVLTASSTAVTVTAPRGVTVTPVFFRGTAYHWDDYYTRELVTAVEALTGLPVSSFHGTYKASSFTIEEGTTWPTDPAYPDCAGTLPTGPSAGPDPTVVSGLAACAGVVAESHTCLTTTGAEVRAFGLETGSSCAVVAGEMTDYSLAWLDQYLYACAEDYGILTRTDLLTGAVARAYVYCDGVVAYDGQLLVFTSHYEPTLPTRHTFLFEDFWQAQCGAGTDLGETPYDMRHGMVDDTLYTVWHASDHATPYTLPAMTRGEDVPLEGYDDWIYGLDGTGDGQLVINSTRTGTYSVFDATTGALDLTLPSAGFTYGLECVAN